MKLSKIAKNNLFPILLSAIHLSNTPSPFLDRGDVLVEEDYEMEASQTEPALTSGLGQTPYLESYNQWLCFYRPEIQYNCEESSIIVEYDSQIFLFEDSFNPFISKQCNETFAKWGAVLDQQDNVCFFAANWPTTGDPAVSYWALYGIKSPSGKLMAPIYEENYLEE